MVTPKRILFYYPSNKRTIALETLLIELRKREYEILILSTCAKGDFHWYMESLGFPTYTNQINSTGSSYYFKQIVFLIRFCKKHKIDFVHSHLQHTNFIAVLAHYFISAKLILFRHHFRYIELSDEKIELNRNEIFFDKVINSLAKTIVVPSTGVYNGINKYEKVNMKKYFIIPYIYNFSNYDIPKEKDVDKIKQLYSCELMLIMVSRLIKLKRHQLVFEVVKELIDEGYAIKLLVLDEGPEKQQLETYIDSNNLQHKIIMLGFRTNFADYMAAADLLIQPSLTDASNSVAKEMALYEKAIAVSKNVGDYDEYIRDNENGFLIPLYDSAKHIKEIIVTAYTHKETLTDMGKKLKNEVIAKFDSRNSSQIIALYQNLMRE